MTILALDTSSSKTGYAIYKDGKIIEHGSIRLIGHGDSDTEKIQNRLAKLYTKIGELISKHNITQIVAEDIFRDSDPRKQKAFDVLAQCRGIVIASNTQNELPPVFFINPLKVKHDIWGYSSSIRSHRIMTRQEQKERMCKAVEHLGYKLKIDRKSNKDNDQADAIGILITYLNAHDFQVTHPKPI
jgi:crossover junction endodeoxyribonuclease RuvC